MSFVFAGQWGPHPVLSMAGDPLPSATFEVFEADGTTPAVLYTDQTKAAVQPQPVEVDALANATFYAVPGRYVIRFESFDATTSFAVPAWVDPLDVQSEADVAGAIAAYGATLPVLDGVGEFATVQAAIDAADEGGTVRIPKGAFPEALVVDRVVRLFGQGCTYGTSPVPSPTRIVPPHGSSGIVVMPNAIYSHFEGFEVDGGVNLDAVTPGAETADGLQIRARRVTVKRVRARRMGRHGVNNDSTITGSEELVMGLQAEHVRSEWNVGDGWHVQGGNATIARMDSCDGVLNGGWGFNMDSDHAVLVNTHTSHNRTGAYRDNGVSNRYISPYVEAAPVGDPTYANAARVLLDTAGNSSFGVWDAAFYGAFPVEFSSTNHRGWTVRRVGGQQRNIDLQDATGYPNGRTYRLDNGVSGAGILTLRQLPDPAGSASVLVFQVNNLGTIFRQYLTPRFDKALDLRDSAAAAHTLEAGTDGRLRYDGKPLSTRESVWTALRLPATSGNYLSTPDHASLDIAGDIDLRVRLANVASWTTAAQNALLAKYGSAGSISYGLRQSTTGGITLDLSADGTAVTSATACPSGSLPAAPFSGWLRVTWRASDGRVQGWAMREGESTWTLLHTSTLAVASIHISGADLEVGSYTGGTVHPSSRAFSGAQVLDGIDGTLVADLDLRAPVHPRYKDSTGKTWTVNGSAWAWETVAG